MRLYYYYDEEYGKFPILQIDFVNHIGWYFRDYDHINNTFTDEEDFEWVKVSLDDVREESQ